LFYPVDSIERVCFLSSGIRLAYPFGVSNKPTLTKDTDMRIRDSRPLIARLSEALQAAEVYGSLGARRLFNKAQRRAVALSKAFQRRRATLAAWDLAVSYYRDAETQDLRTAYETDRQAAIILSPFRIPEIPISVAFGN